MLSYHNNPAIKEKFVQRFAEHRAADAVIQGTGYNNLGRGCFVGCTLKNYDHTQFPVELGWPEWLAHLADKIFEGLPKEEAAQFGTDLLDAAPVGVNLDPVRFHLAISRHTRQIERMRGNTEPYSLQCIAAIEGVIEYCKKALVGCNDELARSAAESAARSAALSAARSAAWSAAESAAESAARSAALSAARSAARSAAWSAAESAAGSAALSAEYQIERDTLLAVLRSMKPAE